MFVVLSKRGEELHRTLAVEEALYLMRRNPRGYQVVRQGDGVRIGLMVAGKLVAPAAVVVMS